jgi:aspartyl protease family protein
MSFNSFESGDWQNFIYLLLILLVMAGSLFSRRDFAFGKILKYLVIWSAVGLMIIILYSYRYEFSDLKNRVLGEINPTAARINESGELVINLSQDGHFYMDADVNGVAMRFMIDTGASDLVIGVDDAKKIGVDFKKLIFNKPYQTANGISWGASITLREIKVGDIKFHNVAASVNNADMGVALLGMSFLRKFKKYEFYRDKLILTGH